MVRNQTINKLEIYNFFSPTVFFHKNFYEFETHVDRFLCAGWHITEAWGMFVI